jgi:hypothetical protein
VAKNDQRSGTGFAETIYFFSGNEVVAEYKVMTTFQPKLNLWRTI